jgi:hypothetical protein
VPSSIVGIQKKNEETVGLGKNMEERVGKDFPRDR